MSLSCIAIRFALDSIQAAISLRKSAICKFADGVCTSYSSYMCTYALTCFNSLIFFEKIGCQAERIFWVILLAPARVATRSPFLTIGALKNSFIAPLLSRKVVISLTFFSLLLVPRSFLLDIYYVLLPNFSLKIS